MFEKEKNHAKLPWNVDPPMWIEKMTFVLANKESSVAQLCRDWEVSECFCFCGFTLVK